MLFNRFAQSQMNSPTKKRSFHDTLAKNLRSSPSPKKATLSVFYNLSLYFILFFSFVYFCREKAHFLKKLDQKD